MNIVSGNNLHISSEGNIFDTKNKNQENDKDNKTFQFNLNTSSEKTSFEKTSNSKNPGAMADLEKENQSKLRSFNASEQVIIGRYNASMQGALTQKLAISKDAQSTYQRKLLDTEQTLQDIYPKDSKAYKKEMLKQKNILDKELKDALDYVDKKYNEEVNNAKEKRSNSINNLQTKRNEWQREYEKRLAENG